MRIKKKTIGPHMEHTDQKVRALVRGIPNEQLRTPLGDDVHEASEVIVRKVVRWLADGFTEGAAMKRYPHVLNILFIFIACHYDIGGRL